MAVIANFRHVFIGNKSALFANATFRFSFIDSKKQMRKELHLLPKEELSQVLLSPPIKPKKSLTPYLAFRTEYLDIMRKKPNPPATKDIIKLAGEKWKSMSESERSQYEMTARHQNRDQELKEYQQLMMRVVTVSDVIDVITDITNIAKKERRQLKKTSGHLLFYHEEAQKNKGLKLSELLKRWNALSEDKRNEYKAAAEKINKETKDRIRQWKEKYKFMN